MLRKLIAVAISVILLSTGWLSLSGLPLLVALVPLLWISASAEDSRKGWWSTFRYSLLTFVLWNAATVWWIWNATPAGPIAATIFSSALSLIAFMSFHTLSRKTTKAKAYTLLISLWIALEFWYTATEDFSWPWLLLGNGFSSDIWAIQWYEYTGLFGGSLWVLLSNVLIFEAWQQRSRAKVIAAAVVVFLPLALSLAIYWSYEEPQDQGEICVTVVQPNIHFERKDQKRPTPHMRNENLVELVSEAPSESDFIVMPECAIATYIYIGDEGGSLVEKYLRQAIARNDSDAAVVSGVSTVKYYDRASDSPTARIQGEIYYDVFNTALYLPQQKSPQLHHKSKLVIGTENIPFVKFVRSLSKFIIPLEGNLGQLGRGTEQTVFEDPKATVGAAICYEALYGDYYGEFVRNGAEAMFVISNDCWWDNTPGYRHLFSMSALRAVEHRRAIARSANTGISGFISQRGDSLETMGWDERGVLTAQLPLNSQLTVYTRYGDYVARLAVLMALLTLLDFMVYRIRRRNHLV